MLSITSDMINNAEHKQIIASGILIDGGKTNLAGTGKKITWVAVRGFINDFVIYTEHPFSDESGFYPNLGEWELGEIMSKGDKLPKYMVSNVVNIEKETLAKYRV